MSKFEISKVYMLSVCKDIVIRKFEFEEKLSSFWEKLVKGFMHYDRKNKPTAITTLYL